MHGHQADRAAADGSEFELKLERVRRLLGRHGSRALVLTSRESLAWLLCGARVTVPTNGDPVVSVVVSADDVTLHVFTNERDRMLAEELVGLPFSSVVEHPWFQPLPGIGEGLEGALAESAVSAELRALRAPLLPSEVTRYRSLGAEVAAAVTRIARSARSEDTERTIAAELAREVVAMGAEPVVTLVAGQSRLELRHPLPTSAPLGTRSMLVLGARRGGLIVNLTRWIGEERGSGELAARLFEVEADAFEATRPGRPLSDVLADVVRSYATQGFNSAEWLRHHQGGPTGYAGRDPRATPAAQDVVQGGQAFAWNPSAPRGKVEDTVVITGGRPDVLTCDPEWPTVSVRGVARPLALLS